MPRKTVLLIAGVLLIAAVAWFTAAELLWPARLMLVVLTAALPAIAAVQVRTLAQLEPFPRLALYLNSILSLWIITALTLIAARASGFTPALLGLRIPDTGSLLIWTAAVLAVAALVYALLKLLKVRESRLLIALLPQTRMEKVVFVAVAFTAGICEELIFRGFLTTAFAAATGSLPVAVVLSALVFGSMHLYQSRAGFVRAAILGITLTLPLLFAGSIIPAMVAHLLIDLIGGLLLPRWWIASKPDHATAS